MSGAKRKTSPKNPAAVGKTAKRGSSIVVETKRKRVVVPKSGTDTTKAYAKRPAGISDAELARRMKALQAAQARKAEEASAREAEENARTNAGEDARRKQRAQDSSTAKSDVSDETELVTEEEAYLALAIVSLEKEAGSLRRTAREVERVANMVINHV